MNCCPVYHPPVVVYESSLDRTRWQPALRLFEEGRHEESFRTLLSYINHEKASSCEKKPGHWVIPHGSLIMEIRITPDGFIEITAPFVRIPDEKRAPLLRQALEINTAPLTLPQLILKDGEFHFFFRTPLVLAHPDKMYRVLFEICIYGDSFDDEFITRYGATPLRPKKVRPFTPKKIEMAWTTYRSILEESIREAKQFAAKRLWGFGFEILGIGLMRIDHSIAPQGYLRTRLERSINHLFDQKSAEDLFNQMMRDAEALLQLSREEFAADCYRADFFVSAKKTAEMEACRKTMEQRWEWAREDRARHDFQGVSFCYLFAVYNVLYNAFIPEMLEKEIVTTLKAMAGKEWEKAGMLAWESYQKIMDPAFG